MSGGLVRLAARARAGAAIKRRRTARPWPARWAARRLPAGQRCRRCPHRPARRTPPRNWLCWGSEGCLLAVPPVMPTRRVTLYTRSTTHPASVCNMKVSAVHVPLPKSVRTSSMTVTTANCPYCTLVMAQYWGTLEQTPNTHGAKQRSSRMACTSPNNKSIVLPHSQGVTGISACRAVVWAQSSQ